MHPKSAIGAQSDRLRYLLQCLVALCWCLMFTVEANASAVVNIYVSVAGDDGNSGLGKGAGSGGPVQSLKRALDVAKALRQSNSPDAQLVVNLLPGIYRLTSPLAIDEALAGTAAAPLVIQGTDAASVRITGTQLLGTLEQNLDSQIASRLPQASKPHIVEFDLNKNGIRQWAPMSRRSFNSAAEVDASEIFVNGVPQHLARWPESGYATITKVPDGKSGASFGIDAKEAGSWANAQNVWVYGYWYYNWADAYLPLSGRMDDHTFSLAPPLPSFGIRTGQRVRFENIPEELKTAGQWYFDTGRGLVFLWLDSPLSQNTVEISTAPGLLTISKASHLRLRNITFDGVRGDLIAATGVEDFVVEHCVLKNSGKAGMQIQGVNSGIRQSTVSDVGGMGVMLQGGDRKTLTPGNLFATSNVFTRFGRIYHTYQPAVRVDGVGNRVDHNVISDAPHSAIIFNGNEHLIAYNELHDVVTESSDAGAIYIGRDWTARGSVVEYNYLHDINGVAEGSNGIYLDDQASGIHVLGNVFFNVRHAIFVGGGSDNAVEGNLFVRSSPAVHLDNRGMNWMQAETKNPQGDLQKHLAAVPYNQGPYKQRYPTLAAMTPDEMGVPKRNSFQGNVVVGGTLTEMLLPPEVLALQNVGQNLASDTPQFVKPVDWSRARAPRAVDFELSPGSPAFKNGFKPIPLEQIGLAAN